LSKHRLLCKVPIPRLCTGLVSDELQTDTLAYVLAWLAPCPWRYRLTGEELWMACLMGYHHLRGSGTLFNQIRFGFSVYLSPVPALIAWNIE